MKVVEVQFVPWDRTYYFDPLDFVLQVKDKVIVKTELGTEIGEVIALQDISEKELLEIRRKKTEGDDFSGAEETEKEQTSFLKPIVRLATASDIQKLPGLKDKKEALDFIKQIKDRLGLPMKFIDVHFAYDNSRLTFAFIADGRVDFREMVKELTRHFGRTIRLQQIGIRDEAKIMGDIGHCGKGLCCRGHLDKLESITSEMAEMQQCSHRGSDRISGVCGRLMCCLAYEQQGYEEAAKKMPKIGARVNVDGKRGEVVGHHVLKQSVDVAFSGEKGDSRTVVEVDLNRHKKKK